MNLVVSPGLSRVTNLNFITISTLRWEIISFTNKDTSNPMNSRTEDLESLSSYFWDS